MDPLLFQKIAVDSYGSSITDRACIGLFHGNWWQYCRCWMNCWWTSSSGRTCFRRGHAVVFDCHSLSLPIGWHCLIRFRLNEWFCAIFWTVDLKIGGTALIPIITPFYVFTQFYSFLHNFTDCRIPRIPCLIPPNISGVTSKGKEIFWKRLMARQEMRYWVVRRFIIQVNFLASG